MILLLIFLIPCICNAAKLSMEISWNSRHGSVGVNKQISSLSGSNSNFTCSHTLTNITCSQTNNVCGSGTITIKYVDGSSDKLTVDYRDTNWKESSVEICKCSQQPSKNLSRLKYAFGGEYKRLSNGGCSDGSRYYYCYTEGYTRCNGTLPGNDQPKVKEKCYRADLSTLDKPNTYDYKWGSKGDSNYKEVPGIKSKEECELLNPNYCIKSNLSNPIDYNYNCVNNLKTGKSQTVSCQNNSTDFYEVTCKETFNVKYLPELNGEVLNIKRGIGFNYEINLESNMECTGIFNVIDWNEAYKRAKDLKERAIKANESSEISFYENKLNDILSAVDNFKRWQVSENNKTKEATINIKYQEEKKKDMNHIENFVITEKSKVSNKNDLSGCSILSNNIKVCPFTLTSNYEYFLTPPKSYIDKASGEIIKIQHDADGNITNDLTNIVDGGNKFYISMEAVSGSTYTIDTEIKGLGMNGDINIINSGCSLNIEETGKDLYRIINESNPFVNPERKKNAGKNWISDLFDFTGVIARGKNPLYTFNLSSIDTTDFSFDIERIVMLNKSIMLLFIQFLYKNN